MLTDTQIRNQIIRKIYQIPIDKLTEIDEFLSKLERDISIQKKNLSFAGVWKNIDESVFIDLTDNLIKNRTKNRKRIDE